MSNLQAKINNLMSQKKMSAVDIEKETGINRNTVYSIITGTSKNPSANNLQLIAKALDVTLESILIDKDDIQIDSLSNKQMQAFSEATRATIDAVTKRNLNFSLDKLIALIKEAYQYSIKVDPPCVDDRFIEWILDKYKN
jgi:transcriptional regulator with XRE-family HTH domain